MRRYKGSVSLFTAMIFLMVVSVITTTIMAARVRGAMAVVGCAASASLDSVFASYDSGLFSEFGVLLLNAEGGEEDLASKIQDYTLYNTDVHKGLIFSGTTDLFGIKNSSVSVTDMAAATDYGGLLWQDMVVEYEKYAKPIDLAADYLGIKDKEEEATEVDSICNDIKDCTDGIIQIAKNTRSLAADMDGVKCDDNGIDFARLVGMTEFYKQFCPGEVSSGMLQIENSNVFGTVNSKATDVMKLADKAKKAVKAGRKDIALAYLEEIKKLASNTLDIGDRLLRKTRLISEMEAAIEKAADVISTRISDAESLEDEIRAGLEEELENLRNSKEAICEQICDVNGMTSKLESNATELSNIIEYINKFEISKSETEQTQLLNNIINSIGDFRLDGMAFNYDSMKKSDSNMDILDSLSKFMDEGVLAFILPNDATLSNGVVNIKDDAASKVCDYSSDDNHAYLSSAGTKIAKDVIYTEYVMDKFNHYTYKEDAVSGNHTLQYEAEYILYGKPADSQNLLAAVMNIAAIRSGFNMLYLLTDSEKKEEAYTIALLIAGASAFEPLIRLVQYTLLYLWAYAEGIVDARTLLADGKVPVMKTAEDWKLSLDNLMEYNLDVQDSDNDRGMTYDDFIRFLICVQYDGERAARTMDLVEVQMMKSDENFRLKNMVYGLEANLSYSLSGINKKYNYKTGYTY